MIASEDTAWYLLDEALKNEPQRSVSVLLHSIRDSKVSVKAAFFETVKTFRSATAIWKSNFVRLIMTGLGSSEMQTVVDSELAVGHLAFKVADLKSSCQFYANLGIPPFAIEERVGLAPVAWTPREARKCARSGSWRKAAGASGGRSRMNTRPRRCGWWARVAKASAR